MERESLAKLLVDLFSAGRHDLLTKQLTQRDGLSSVLASLEDTLQVMLQEPLSTLYDFLQGLCRKVN